MVRSVGAEGVVGEGPVRRAEPDLHGASPSSAGCRSHELVRVEHWGLSARIAQACYGIWFYMIKTVLPMDITAFYPFPERVDWLEPPFLSSILGTLAVSSVLFLLRRRWPGLLAAWLSYLVILAPNLGPHADQRPDRRGSV